MKIQISGLGSCLPEGILSNLDLEKMVDTSDKWIVDRTGIKERRIADKHTACSDLAWEASLQALQRAKLEPEQLDLIIVATNTPDMMFPATACILQDKLKAYNAGCFDLEAGCTGFIYAAAVAEKFLLSPDYQNILVVGVDLVSRIIDYTDRNTCVLFGDGAGAAIFSKGEGEYGIMASFLGADGRGREHLFIPGGGSLHPASAETVAKRMHFVKMNGQEVFKFSTTIVEEVGKRLLDRVGLTFQDIDLFVPHQANLRIIKSMIRRCGIPLEKTIINIEKYGNISAGSIPVMLTEAEREGRIKPGNLVLMIAFGAGLTYGGLLVRWGSEKIHVA